MPFLTQKAAGMRSHLKVHGSDYRTLDRIVTQDYIHVSDLVKAHVSSLAYMAKMKALVEVFKVETRNGTSFLEMVYTFKKVNELNSNYIFIDRRPKDFGVN